MKKFEKNNSIYFECTYRSFDGTVTDPQSPIYKIEDSKGNEEQTGTPEGEDGVYYFYWTSDIADTYRVTFTGTIGGKTGVARQIFKVVETKIE